MSDFGLAKRLASDATRTLAPAGTPAYMAPEQAGGKSRYVGPGADVYALGAVLYECLTGNPPFDGPDPWAIIEQVLNASPVSPRATNPVVPRDLELICLKCLEKEAHHRYHGAAALADDLRRFLAGEPVSVRPIGPLTRAARRARKRPAAAALVALVTLLCFAVPAAVVWNVAESDRGARETATAREEQRLAEIARIEADKATAAALRLADVRDLFAVQTNLRNRAADRPLSWTFQTGGDLPKAVALAAGEPGALGDLRSAAAVAFLAADLKPLDPVVKGFTASAAATDPRTGAVAAGEYLVWVGLKARVRLIDPADGRVTRELTFTAGLVRGPNGALKGQPDSVRALAFSADGTRLFVGTKSSQVIRFDLDKPGNEPADAWKASVCPLEQLAVSRDGKTVYGLCRPEKPVFAWSADTGKEVARLEPAAEAPFAPFAPFAVLATGDVVACDAHQLRRWTPDLKPAQTVASAGAWRLAATPAGALLVGDGCNLDVYDRDALTPLDRFATPELRRGIHEENVRTIVVHPSGAFVATSSGDNDRSARVWELASGRLVGTVAVTGTGPIALVWAGDGKTLFATASDQLARWSFRAGDAHRFACQSGPPIATATFLPGGRGAALAEPVGARRELLVGAAGGLAASVVVPPRGGRMGLTACPVAALAVGPDVPCLVTSEPPAAVAPRVFNPRITWCPRFSPDGQALWAIVSSSDVYSFDPVTKQARGKKWSNGVEGTTLGLSALDALAVGRTVVAAGGRSGSVHLLDHATGAFVTTFAGHGDPVLALALAPDDSLAVAGTQNGKLRAIRLGDRQELTAAAAHPGGLTAAAFSRDGSLLATGGRDRVVRLWKRTGDRFEPLFAVSDMTGPVRELQFDADGRLLVLVAHERAVRVWDVEKLKSQLGEFKLGW